MGKGSRHDRGKTKTQRKEQVERKRDERSQRNTLKKEKKANGYSGGDEGDYKSFRNQLQVQGFKMRDVVGDGNCLFRALADQLDGDENMHGKHRKETVCYMREHKDDFIPFIEESVTFDTYLQNLSSRGTYGGNDSIVAFARNHGANIIIHQHNNPTFIVEGSDEKIKKIIIHLAYHDFEHYSSVRRINDPGTGPAYTFHNERDSIATYTERGESTKETAEDCGNNSKTTVQENCEDQHCNGWIDDAVEKIRSDSGCQDSGYIRNVFIDNSYDASAALSFILQTMCLGEDKHALAVDQSETVYSDSEEKNGVVCGVKEDKTSHIEESSVAKPVELLSNSSKKLSDEKNIEKDDLCNSKDSCNDAGSRPCSCHKGDGKSNNEKCSCDKGKKRKEKRFEEDVKEKPPVEQTVKKPSNRQRKELAKQARKKRRQENKKDTKPSDTKPTFVENNSSESIKLINI